MSWQVEGAHSISMAWLWRDQGKAEGSRDLLARVYDWFSEGFDTRDLKEAGVARRLGLQRASPSRCEAP